MRVQQEIAYARNESLVGEQVEVLIDRAKVDGQPDVWVGRTYADAPDVDSLVWVTGEDLTVGQFVPCEVVATSQYDLVAVPVGPAV